MDLSESGTVSFLSTKKDLSWSLEGKNTVIDLPEYDPNKIKVPYAYVIKIENYGRFAVKPSIKVDYDKGAVKPVISILATGVEAIHYTTDGSEPSLQSALYTKPFSIDITSVIKVKSYLASILPSATLTENVKVYNWMNPVKTGKLQPGILYSYYQPEMNINMVSSFKTALVSSGIADNISVAKKQRIDKFAFEFNGYIKVDKEAIYNFYTASDDGSKLFIDDIEVVDNDGDHGTVEKSGKAALRKGYHKLRVIYFDSGVGNELHVFIQPEGEKKEQLSPSLLFH